jgi:hypothetical protein
MRYGPERISCDPHNRILKDERGCWACIEALNEKGKKKGKAYVIPRQSPKARKQESTLSQIKKELLKESPVCFSSGETSNLTLSHIIPRTVRAFAEYKENLVLECFHVHEIWEHNKPLFAHLYPVAWQEKLRRVRTMSREHYEKLLQKVGKSPIL